MFILLTCHRPVKKGAERKEKRRRIGAGSDRLMCISPETQLFIHFRLCANLYFSDFKRFSIFGGLTALHRVHVFPSGKVLQSGISLCVRL